MKLPLAGIRVLEFTHVWSGPLCGQVLADLGAEVIRVESRGRLDIHRRGGPYADGIPGPNRSGTWNSQNRNKLACTVDLKHAEGRELMLQLAELSDVVIENFTPGTLQRLGLGFDRLRTANPRVVVLSLSGYGQTGPLRDSLAYGPMMDAASGLSAATTYGDGIPRAVNGWAADVGGALHGCAAVLRALGEQPRCAVHLDVSQFEAGVLFLAGPIMEAQEHAKVTPVLRLSACTAQADDWIAVSAASIAQITALFDTVAGAAAASGLMRLLHAEGLAACSQAMQPSLALWAGQRTQRQALDDMLGVGVSAVPISRVEDLLDDPELIARHAFLAVQHAEVGATRNYGPPIRLLDGEGRGPAYERPAPLLGGDNEHVYGGILGLPPHRINELADRGVI